MTLSLGYFEVILNLHILLGGISVDSCQPLEPAMVGARTRNASQQSKLFSVIFPKKYIIKERPRITYLAITIWFPIFRTNFGTNQQEVHVENRFWKLIFFGPWMFMTWLRQLACLVPWEKFAYNVCPKIHR